MSVSLRLPLIAGTAAALTAGAVVVTPAGHPERLLEALASTSSAQVSLTAFANPFNALLATAELAQNYTLGAYYNGGDAPTAGAGEANWPYAGFDQVGGDVLNYQLYNDPALGYYNWVGTAPNNVDNASPVIRQLEVNWSSYGNAVFSGLIDAATAVSTGVWDYPAALVDAAQLALAGQFTQAIGVLIDAVVTPAAAAAQSLFDAGAYIVSNVAARLGTVIQQLPQIIRTFTGWAVGGAALLAERTASIASTWLSQLAQLDIEGAWNTAVNGWLGPEGLPGLALNLSMGAGVQTGAIVNPTTDIATNFVPSLRTATLAAVWSTAAALQTSAPGSSAARSAAATPVEAEAASPVTAVAEAAGSATEAAEPAAEGSASTTPAIESRGAAATRKDGASSARTAHHPRAKRATAAAE